ncbi:MAG: chloride channel protein [Dehalococcoidia bacterium]|nr:chloride channel protein [Dehalococcoidia bacterium]
MSTIRPLTEKLNALWDRVRGSETAVAMTLAVVIGLLTGLGAVGFRYMIRGFGWLFFNRGAELLDFLGDYYVIILPVVGGLLVGLVIYFLAREAKGEGPPEVMEAVALGGGRIRQRVAVVKALASSICIGSGGSVGREGPIVHIGASIGSTIGQWFKMPEDWTKTLLLCGAAGGISATFNAPLGGIIFALEVIERRFVGRNFAFILVSSITADLVAHSLLGSDPSFLIPDYAMYSNWEMAGYVVLGLVAALAGVAFVRFFYLTQDLFKVRLRRIPSWLMPAIGGLVVGLIGLFYPLVFGVGYGRSYGPGGELNLTGGVDAALMGGEMAFSMLLILLVLKVVATSATLGSGGSGGVFAPALFIGAMLGGAFGLGFNEIFPTVTGPAAEASGSFALVGMGAFFAAVVHGPMTAIILLFEMTRNYSLILPLMAAVITAYTISRTLNRESIYTLGLLRRGVDVHQRQRADVLAEINVADIMTRDFPTVLPTMTLPELMELFHESGHHGFPVVDKWGDLCGCVTLQDVEGVPPDQGTSLTVSDIACKSPVVAYPDQSVKTALAQLGGRDVGRIPVVDRNNPKRLLGVLRRHNVVDAYVKGMSEKPRG